MFDFESGVKKIQPDTSVLVDEATLGINTESLSFLETVGSKKIKEVVERSIYDKEFALTFSTTKVIYSPEKVITVAFTGFGDGTEPIDIEVTGVDYLNNTISALFVPQEGTVVYVKTPPGIAGPDMASMKEATERVFITLLPLLNDYNGYEVRIGGYSAGTHLAHYITNRLNTETHINVKKMYTNATGTNIAAGIATAPPVERLKEHIEQSGGDITEYEQFLKDNKLSQEATIEGLVGATTVYGTYGKSDGIILPDHPKGTLAQLDRMQRAGVDVRVKEIETPWGCETCHASLILYLSSKVAMGKDPYEDRDVKSMTPADWLQTEESLRTLYLQKIAERINNLSEKEKFELARYIVQPGSDVTDPINSNVNISGGVLDNLDRHPVIALLTPERQAVGQALRLLGYLNTAETRAATLFTLSKKSREYWSQAELSTQLGYRLRRFWFDESSGVRGDAYTHNQYNKKIIKLVALTGIQIEQKTYVPELV